MPGHYTTEGLIKDNANCHYFVKKSIFELIPNLFLAPHFWSHWLILPFTQILFFREPKLRFQHVRVIEIRSSVFNLLLQIKFQSLFLELKLRSQKWIFYPGNKVSILETELRVWVVIKCWKQSFDFNLF